MSRYSSNSIQSSVASLLLGISVLLLLSYFYLQTHNLFSPVGYVYKINTVFFSLCKESGYLCYSLSYKIGAIIFLCLAILATRVRRDDPIERRSCIYYLCMSVLLVTTSNWTLFLYGYFFSKIVYICELIGYMGLLYSLSHLKRLSQVDLLQDAFNLENESFAQQITSINTPDSINLTSEFYFKGKWNKGCINILNPYRGTLVLGTPGSGKSYTFINSFISQLIQKGFSMVVYDFKFCDLTLLAYNTLLQSSQHYLVKPEFYVLNFDDVSKSHRCNPIQANYLHDISDAYQAAHSILLNLNRSWIAKQGDFFVESPIILLSAVIWFLKLYDNGKYCTLPHVIEFINQPYQKIFPILNNCIELQNYLSAFMDAWQGGAQDQLQGQIASVKIPLSRLISKNLYWIMSHSDFNLDINDPLHPKILCLGNNPSRQSFYGAALGLYTSRIIKLINQKDKAKCALIIDELPTLYISGLDQLIATARSNKVAICLGVQDYSQLVRDYGEKESKVIFQTIGNVFSGQTLGDTARNLSERFGKVLQKRNAFSLTDLTRSDSVSTQLDMLIPSAKISGLKQGYFVGSVASDPLFKQEQTTFHGRVIISKTHTENQPQAKLPRITKFKYKGSPVKQNSKKTQNRNKQEQLDINFNTIKKQVLDLVNTQFEAINNPYSQTLKNNK